MHHKVVLQNAGTVIIGVDEAFPIKKRTWSVRTRSNNSVTQKNRVRRISSNCTAIQPSSVADESKHSPAPRHQPWARNSVSQRSASSTRGGNPFSTPGVSRR